MSEIKRYYVGAFAIFENESMFAGKETKRMILAADHDATVALWREYAELLGAELLEVIGLAATHGWKSSRYEEGKRLRAALGIGEGT